MFKKSIFLIGAISLASTLYASDGYNKIGATVSYLTEHAQENTSKINTLKEKDQEILDEMNKKYEELKSMIEVIDGSLDNKLTENLNIITKEKETLNNYMETLKTTLESDIKEEQKTNTESIKNIEKDIENIKESKNELNKYVQSEISQLRQELVNKIENELKTEQKKIVEDLVKDFNQKIEELKKNNEALLSRIENSKSSKSEVKTDENSTALYKDIDTNAMCDNSEQLIEGNGEVLAYWLNVRTNPGQDDKVGKNNKIIAVLKNKDLVYITGETAGKWIKIKLVSKTINGIATETKTGWVHSKYIRNIKTPN